MSSAAAVRAAGRSSRLARWLTHDYTPWANRYVYWLKTPLGVLLVAAMASLLVSVTGAPQGLVVFAAIAVIIAIGIAWPWIGMWGLSAVVQFDRRRATEGDPVDVVVTVRNRWPFPVWGLAVEGGFFLEGRGDESLAVALACVPGWSCNHYRWTWRPACRGVFPKVQPHLTTQFPFGLWKAQSPMTAAEKLLVWPRGFPIPSFPLPAGTHRTVASPSDFCQGDEGDRVGVRPFRPGDALRNVHWALTARHDQLIVSERQGSAHTSIRLQIDLDPAIHSGGGGESSREWSIRLAASLAACFIERNATVQAILGGRHVEVRPGRAHLARFLDELARLDELPDQATTGEAVRRASRAFECDFAVRVTTDAARMDDSMEKSTPREHRIVLVRAAFSPPYTTLDDDQACEAVAIDVAASAEEDPLSHTSTKESASWIWLDNRQDVAGQLSRAWASRSREVWCGVC